MKHGGSRSHQTGMEQWVRSPGLSRSLMLGLLVAAAALLAARVLDGKPSVVPTFTYVSDEVACTETAFQTADGESVVIKDGIRMAANTFLRRRLCSPSNLTIEAEGTVGGGIGSRLSVSVGSTTFFNEPITMRRKLEWPVDGPSWLLVAFTNDYYQPPEDRNLSIRELAIEPVVDAGLE